MAAHDPDEHRITTAAALRDRYGAPMERALAKAGPALTAAHRAVLQVSPFFVLATVGPDGLDASPRGGPPGFLVALDDHTVAFPDHRGNRRLDSFENLLADDRCALLVLVPGSNETLRLMGRASLHTDPDLLARVDPAHPPLAAVVVALDEVFHHCAKAPMRAKLWDPSTWPVDPPKVTSAPDSKYEGKLYGRDEA